MACVVADGERHPMVGEEVAGRPLAPGIHREPWLSRSEMAAPGERLHCPLVPLGIDAWLTRQRLPLSSLNHLPRGLRA